MLLNIELLGITLEKNINFKRHIQKICHKANTKTKALLRRRKFLNLEQAQVIAEAYISSNFRYSPLIWMFCGKMSYNLIVKTHYRTLRAIYDTQTRLYEELLHLSEKKKIHMQNLQILMVELYKYLNNGARKNAPQKNAPGKSAPRKITPRNKLPQENCPPGKLPPLPSP